MTPDYSFIHSRWYQEFFAEPAAFRWLWRLANTWVSDEDLEKVPEFKRDDLLGMRLMCMVDEVAYRRRRRAMRSKVKYTGAYHRNKESLRAELLARDGDRCAICHRPLRGDYSLDHIDNTMLPDGSLNSDVSNLRLTHALCNSRRGTRQNRKQNRAWKKATRGIAAIHNVDPTALGRADRPPKRRRHTPRRASASPDGHERRREASRQTSQRNTSRGSRVRS